MRLRRPKVRPCGTADAHEPHEWLKYRCRGRTHLDVLSDLYFDQSLLTEGP